MFVWYFAIISFVCALVYYLGFRKKNKIQYFQNIPGPTPNLIFGNALDFIFKPPEKYFQQLYDYLDTYGKTVKVKTGPYRTGILTSDPKMHEFFLKSPKALDKSTEYIYFRNWIGTGIFTMPGEEWKLRRRMLNPALHVSLFHHYLNIFTKVSDTLIEKLKEEVGKEKFDLFPLVSLALVDVMFECTYGYSLNCQNNKKCEYVTAVKKVSSILVNRSVTPYHDSLYFLSPTCYTEKAAIKTIHDFTYKIIDKKLKEIEDEKQATKNYKKNEPAAEKPITVFDIFLESTDEKGRHLTREELRGELDSTILAGFGTSTSNIIFTLYALANNPEVQEKLLEEQKAIFGSLDNPTVTQKELKEMRYLDLVIMESLRLYTAGPYIGRKIAEDIEFDGTIYPKNTSIFFFMHHMHNNPEYFPEPEKFKPERFEDTSKHVPFSYVPFSIGPRRCIGKKIGLIIIKAILSKIIRNFEILPANPNQEPILAAEITMISRNGVWVAMKNRDSGGTSCN